MRRHLAAVSLTVLFTLPCVAWAQEKEIIQMPGALEGLPFSSAVRVGNMLYLSGQIGLDPATEQLPEGGVAPETRQTLENIRAVLEHAGSSLAEVVKCTVFLQDIADYSEMNKVYGEFFSQNPPARSAVAGSGLAFNARVEVECIATVTPR